LTGREQQNVEDNTVREPHDVDAEVPPAREADRVPYPRQADLGRQRDRVLLRGPQRVRRDRLLEPEPLAPRRAVTRPVQARVIREDLDAGADDEDHEEEVQEVLRLTHHGSPGCVCGETIVPG
jgi:hypothetical protein